ncbi:hypothetical protein [Trichococcus collinsii]|uniref:Phosphotransferase system, EIIC n=1 Tax=Trichococcus collinsii TaxID=157076 RepID=A0AB37ZYV4_9LACT|nr:hypothetical protein [Trichococcus collinsii]CZR08086.1 phosphotransferase system eiic [Trichococcus collinsii]SEA23935.1 Phosphotransferase system, EIIC [Trichococcus collinsii]
MQSKCENLFSSHYFERISKKDRDSGIGVLIIGFRNPIAVMTGMHHMFIMIETSLIASTLLNPLITVCAMYSFANAAVCLAIALRTNSAGSGS